MPSIDGYITAKDAEKIRKLRKLACEISEAQSGDGKGPPNIAHGVLTLAESKRRRKRAKSDNWAEGFDEDGDEVEYEDSNGTEVEKDLSDKYNYLKTITVRLFYQPTKKAAIAHYIYPNDFSPEDYKFFDKYVLVNYSLFHFLDEDDD